MHSDTNAGSEQGAVRVCNAFESLPPLPNFKMGSSRMVVGSLSWHTTLVQHPSSIQFRLEQHIGFGLRPQALRGMALAAVGMRQLCNNARTWCTCVSHMMQSCRRHMVRDDGRKKLRFTLSYSCDYVNFKQCNDLSTGSLASCIFALPNTASPHTASVVLDRACILSSSQQP